jgi:hypothetical protein
LVISFRPAKEYIEQDRKQETTPIFASRLTNLLALTLMSESLLSNGLHFKINLTNTVIYFRDAKRGPFVSIEYMGGFFFLLSPPIESEN